jgi:hypothetical protein
MMQLRIGAEDVAVGRMVESPDVAAAAASLAKNGYALMCVYTHSVSSKVHDPPFGLGFGFRDGCGLVHTTSVVGFGMFQDVSWSAVN